MANHRNGGHDPTELELIDDQVNRVTELAKKQSADSAIDANELEITM